jgi:hypothetical protein
MIADVTCEYEVLPVSHEPLLGLDLHCKLVLLPTATLTAQRNSFVVSRYINLATNRRSTKATMTTTRRQENSTRSRLRYVEGHNRTAEGIPCMQTLSIAGSQHYAGRDKTV